MPVQLDLASGQRADLLQQQLERPRASWNPGGVPREKLDDHRQRAVGRSRCRAHPHHRDRAGDRGPPPPRSASSRSLRGRRTSARAATAAVYRLAEPAEVLGAGGKVLTLIDLDDTWLTVFLVQKPSPGGRVRARRARAARCLPDRLLPARISFRSDRAQFTPKSSTR